MRDKVTRLSTNHNLFEKKGEPLTTTSEYHSVSLDSTSRVHNCIVLFLLLPQTVGLLLTTTSESHSVSLHSKVRDCVVLSLFATTTNSRATATTSSESLSVLLDSRVHDCIVLSTLVASATDRRAGFPVELGPELSGLSTPQLTDPSLVCLGVCLAGLKWPRSRQPREPLLPPACSSGRPLSASQPWDYCV